MPLTAKQTTMRVLESVTFGEQIQSLMSSFPAKKIPFQKMHHKNKVYLACKIQKNGFYAILDPKRKQVQFNWKDVVGLCCPV